MIAASQHRCGVQESGTSSGTQPIQVKSTDFHGKARTRPVLAIESPWGLDGVARSGVHPLHTGEWFKIVER